jgi:hypothetical protein
MTSEPVQRASTPIVICALQFEARLLRSALRSTNMRVACCGPGAAGVRGWAQRNAIAGAAGRKSIVLLAGLAGSLRDSIRAGQARVIAEVRDGSGTMIAQPPINPAGEKAIIVTSDSVVCGRAQREALALRSGADLVDLESAAFAAIAEARGWRWGIVRGVSDDLDTPLPPPAAHWVNARGRTRSLRVALDLARGRSRWRDVQCLHANSRRALASCAAHLRAIAVNLNKLD